MIVTSRTSDLEKPIMLVFPFGLLAHYLRCIVICREFKHHFQVKFLYHAEYDSFVKEEGFESFDCSYLDPAKAIEGVRNFDLSWLQKEELEQLLFAQVNLIKTLKPAVVLGDYTPTLKMAAEQTGVRFISLMNGYMSKYYAGTRKISRNHPVYKFIHRFPNRLLSKLTRYGESLAFAKLHKPFKEIRKKYELRPCASYLDELEGDINLVCDLPDLFPQKFLPQGYNIIGPLYYDGPGLPGAAFHTGINGSVDPGKKTILITMGSSGDWSKLSFMNDVHYEQYNVIAIGDTNRVLNNNYIFHLPFVSMHDIFPKIDLMICHGGNGTLYQGLYYGVPILVITNHCEQEWNLEALEKMNLAQGIYDIEDKRKLQKQVASQISRDNSRSQNRMMIGMRSWEMKMPGLVHKLSEPIVISQAKSGIVTYS